MIAPAADPWRRTAIVVPLAVSVAIVTLVLFFEGADAALELLITALVTGTVLGKFAVLRGLEDSGLLDSPYKMGLLIVYLDLFVALIAVFNIRLLHRIPRFGARVAALQASGRDILERNPWMQKATFLGIIAFVMFPLSGTGAIGGSIFGRLLGMSRARTMLGILIGSLGGAFGMAALADLFGEQLGDIQKSGWLFWGGLIFVVAAIGLVWRQARTTS